MDFGVQSAIFSLSQLLVFDGRIRRTVLLHNYTPIFNVAVDDGVGQRVDDAEMAVRQLDVNSARVVRGRHRCRKRRE